LLLLEANTDRYFQIALLRVNRASLKFIEIAPTPAGDITCEASASQ